MKAYNLMSNIYLLKKRFTKVSKVNKESNQCKPLFTVIILWAWPFRRPKASPTVGPLIPLLVHSVCSCLLFQKTVSSPLLSSARSSARARSSSTFELTKPI